MRVCSNVKPGLVTGLREPKLPEQFRAYHITLYFGMNIHLGTQLFLPGLKLGQAHTYGILGARSNTPPLDFQ